jgi:hypothetical protein
MSSVFSDDPEIMTFPRPPAEGNAPGEQSHRPGDVFIIRAVFSDDALPMVLLAPVPDGWRALSFHSETGRPLRIVGLGRGELATLKRIGRVTNLPARLVVEWD